MPPLRRALPALLTGGALLLTSGAPAALAPDGDPSAVGAETVAAVGRHTAPTVRWENAALSMDDVPHTADAGDPGTSADGVAPPMETGSPGTDGEAGAVGEAGEADTREPAPDVDMDDTGISVDNGTSHVEVGPDGVQVNTSGTRVEVARGTYVLVCANGVRVEVSVGEAPPCEPHPEQPEKPGYPEPSVPPTPGEPEPEAPAPEEPDTSEDVPPGGSSTAPAEERVEEAAAPSASPPASPSPVPEVPEEVREQVLADVSPPSGQQTAGAFTPMRTMMVLVVVVAVAATGAGRAAARVSG